MPIRVRCPNPACALDLGAPESAAGRMGRCPACGTRMPILRDADDVFVGFEPANEPTSRPACRVGRRGWRTALAVGGAGGGTLALAVVAAALLAGLGIGRTRPPQPDQALRPAPGETRAEAPQPAQPSPETFDRASALAAVVDGPSSRCRAALDWLAREAVESTDRAALARVLQARLAARRGPDDAERIDLARWVAAWAGPDESTLLLTLLDDPSRDVRGAVIEALGRLGDPRSAEALAHRLIEPADREAAKRALARIGTPARAALEALTAARDVEVRDAARELLERTVGLAGPIEVALHLADLSDPAAGRPRQRDALIGLGRIEPARGQALRSRVVEAVEPMIDDPDERTRAAAVHVLSRWATLASVPALTRALDAEGPDLRRQALEALGRLRVDDPEVVSAVAGRLDDDDDRPHAAAALRSIGPGAEPALLDQVPARSAAVRLEVCRVLRDIGTARSLPALRKLLSDRDPRVADAARRAGEAIVRGRPSAE